MISKKTGNGTRHQDSMMNLSFFGGGSPVKSGGHPSGSFLCVCRFSYVKHCWESVQEYISIYNSGGLGQFPYSDQQKYNIKIKILVVFGSNFCTVLWPDVLAAQPCWVLHPWGRAAQHGKSVFGSRRGRSNGRPEWWLCRAGSAGAIGWFQTEKNRCVWTLGTSIWGVYPIFRHAHISHIIYVGCWFYIKNKLESLTIMVIKIAVHSE